MISTALKHENSHSTGNCSQADKVYHFKVVAILCSHFFLKCCSNCDNPTLQMGGGGGGGDSSSEPTLYAGVGGAGEPPLDLARDLLKTSAVNAICASKYLLKAMHVYLIV